MESCNTPSVWVNLTPESGNYLFGYYDRCPWNRDQSLHLALKVPFQDRLPRPGETAEVGFIIREERRFVKVAETRAWCHQQGAMTLWLKDSPDNFVFNDYDLSDRKIHTRIFNVDGRETGRYEQPVYVISGDCRWGASLNFARIPRRGYSYADVPVEATPPQPDPDEDGLFLIEMSSGRSKLIVRYRDLIERHPFPYMLAKERLWLNHPMFNADGSKLFILFRHCPADAPGAYPWQTHLFTVNLDGSDLRCVLPDVYWRNGAVSHPIWGRTPHEILLDGRWDGNGHRYVVFDESKSSFRAERVSDGMGPMGHLVFSPDRQWILADTYPDETGLQKVALVDVRTGNLLPLGIFRHRREAMWTDFRCDLHPRWSADGHLITIDTIHEGDRKIYLMEQPSSFHGASQLHEKERNSVA